MNSDGAATAEPVRLTATVGTRALPILPTIAHGYRETLRHFVPYVMQSALWACGVGGLGLVLDTVVVPAIRAHGITGSLAGAAEYASPLAEIFILLLGSTTISVAAYRAAIKDEQPRWQRAVRLGRRDLRFLGLTLLFAIVEYAVIFLLAALMVGVARVTGAEPVIRGALETTYAAVLLQLSLVLLGNLVVSATVTPTFGLALPLAAIDAPSGLLRRAARMSRGYRIRLGVISFLALLPVAVGSHATYLAWTPDVDTVAYNLREAAFALIGLLGVAFAATAFASAFRIIADGHSEGVCKVFD